MNRILIKNHYEQNESMIVEKWAKLAIVVFELKIRVAKLQKAIQRSMKIPKQLVNKWKLDFQRAENNIICSIRPFYLDAVSLRSIPT